MKQPTLRDIAKLTGLSIATISRVLNKKPGVREDTRKKVLSACEEAGFDFEKSIPRFPDRYPAIAFLIPHATRSVGFATHIYLTQLQALEAEASKRGFGLFVGTYSSNGCERTSGDVMLERQGVAGVIVSRTRFEDEEFLEFKRWGGPFVVLNRLHVSTVHSVGVNDEHTGYIAARHLIKLGHKRIALITGPEELPSSVLRLRGYRRALKESAIDCETALVMWSDLTAEGGQNAMASLWQERSKPSAVIAINDEMAIGAMHYLRSQNVRIPEDVAVVGFDNTMAGNHVDPPLTSVHVPWHEISTLATRLLLELISTPEIAHARIELEPRLVIRSSCGASPTHVAQTMSG